MLMGPIWWRGAGCVVPVIIIAKVTIVYIGDALQGGLCEGHHCGPIPLSGVLFYFVGPSLIPASIGATIGTLIAMGIRQQVSRYWGRSLQHDTRSSDPRLL